MPRTAKTINAVMGVGNNSWHERAVKGYWCHSNAESNDYAAIRSWRYIGRSKYTRDGLRLVAGDAIRFRCDR